MTKRVTFTVANDHGKRFRLVGTFEDGRTFEMQPIGEITISEARTICQAFAALDAVTEARPTLANVELESGRRA